jgi:biopolymer transport protein ExbD
MNWRVRHQGSPRTVDDLTPEQIAQGLEDGQWEVTDEVQGPDDGNWTPIENHKMFAELAEDIDTGHEKKPDEGTHLDMTALIDVCLVLLVFFILTTGYAALQKLLELGTLDVDDNNKVIRVPKEKVEQLMLQIKAERVNGKTVMHLEKEEIEPGALRGRLSDLVRVTKKVNLLVTHEPDVPWGDLIEIQDAAKFAGIQDAVHWSIPPEFLTKTPKGGK